MRKVAHVVWNELLPLWPVFTTAEVVARAGVTLANASRDLAELEKNDMVVRVRRGLWAVRGHPDFSPSPSSRTSLRVSRRAMSRCFRRSTSTE